MSDDDLVDLNFKVPREFRQKFRNAADDCELSNVEVFRRLVNAWLNYKPPKPDPGPFEDLQPFNPKRPIGPIDGSVADTARPEKLSAQLCQASLTLADVEIPSPVCEDCPHNRSYRERS